MPRGEPPSPSHEVIRSYIAPVAIDAVMRGIGIGEVVASRRDDLNPGDLVFGFTGWQDHAVSDDAANEIPFAVLPSPLPAPLGAFLGVLGHTGITAYLGIEDIGRPQPGETVVVSGAAGAVGSVAGQLAEVRGARVVGAAGSAEKCVTSSRISASTRASTTARPTGWGSSTRPRPALFRGENTGKMLVKVSDPSDRTLAREGAAGVAAAP